MSERAQQLATQFEQVNQAAIAFVEGCSDAQWRMDVPADGRPVCVMAHHVAGGHLPILGIAQTVARGEDATLDPAMIDAINARHAQEHAACTKAETIDLLRRNGATAAAAVRELDDAELDRTGAVVPSAPPWTVQQVIERVLIGHVHSHLDTMRAAVGAS